MAALLLRKVERGLVERLEARAREHGRSVEAEHRAILEAALQPTRPSTGAELLQMLRSGPKVDLEVPADEAVRIPDFGDREA